MLSENHTEFQRAKILVKSDSFYFVYFFSNENSTDDMTEKHRRGGAGGPEHNWTGKQCGWGGGGGWVGKQKYQME